MISVDSNAPYATAFGADLAANAVYLTASDAILGELLAVIYRTGSPKLSVILLGNHGTSGYVDMTLDASSKYFGACRSLSPAHYSSPVRRALAIAVLRTYCTMDRPLLKFLVERGTGRPFEDCEHMYDEVVAGSLGSEFKLVFGKLPRDIGTRIVDAGVLSQKSLYTSVVDVVYKDSDETIDQDNELVYSLGSQLEQLFNPLTEYSPEPAEQLYSPPRDSTYTLEDDPAEAQAVCEELYMVQAHLRGDLIDFHQAFLVPLRISVLKNEIPELTISRLNTIFPPTFDEVLRINNLFYVALQEALPYGSFEVLRACGITLPYFYRALMRHEAATTDFTKLKNLNIPLFQERMEEYGPARIDSVVRSSLNLAKLKLLLDRLANCQEWPASQIDLVLELHAIAISTVDSFGKAGAPEEKYERRTLTPSGKLLSELTTGWPSELEYGWMQNRRVVAIFDGSDVLEENGAKQRLHHIMVLFTDILIILQPQRPIAMTSISGLRIPYVGDMLMHSLLNQVPLDHNLPQLKVVAWASIADLTFTSYNDDRFIQIFAQPYPFRIGKDNHSDKNLFSKTYKLTQPDQSANKLAEILTKTKIATKLQDLHIFKFTAEEEPDVTVYATVHEIRHYMQEKTRFPICLFMNQKIDNSLLDEYGLYGAIAIKFSDKDMVSISVLSKFNYEVHKTVEWSSYRHFIINEICYLMTLYLSSQNESALSSIVATNLRTSHKLVSWAQAPSDSPIRTHRRHPNLSRDMRAEFLSPVVEENVTPGTSVPKSSTASTRASGSTLNIPRMRETQTPGGGPMKLKKKDKFSYEQFNRDRSMRDLAKRPSIASYGLGASQRVPSIPTSIGESTESTGSADGTAIIYRLGEEETVSDFQDYNDNDNSWESMHSDEQEQQDVDEWFEQLDNKDNQSLSTSISTDFPSSHNHSRNSSSNTQASEFQIGGFLDEQESEIYNSHAGEHYPALHSRTNSEFSDFSIDSVHTIGSVESDHSGASTIRSRGTEATTSTASTNRSSRLNSQDYSWLASMVQQSQTPPRSQSGLSHSDAGSSRPHSVIGQSPGGKRNSSYRLYAGLRESSIMDLSAYLRTSETSQSLDFLAMLEEAKKDNDNDILGSNENTPKLS